MLEFGVLTGSWVLDTLKQPSFHLLIHPSLMRASPCLFLLAQLESINYLEDW